MFKRISRLLALQFTGFVFLLFLVNGAIFLIADMDNAQRQNSFRLVREAQEIVRRIPPTFEDLAGAIPPPLRERVRIVDSDGKTLYAGSMMTDVPIASTGGLSQSTIQDEDFDVLTTPILADDQQVAYLQVAEPHRGFFDDLPQRAQIYLIVSVLISGLTYIVGIAFSRRSLAPAEEMFRRLDQFTQDASHELRTPLAVLGSSLDVALKTKKYREGIESAKEDLREIAALVDRILELARLDRFALDLRRVDLSSLITEMAEKFRPLATDHGLAMDSAVADGVTMDADEALLRQAIGNLLSNAIKFTPKGGSIRVRLTKGAIEIADTGIGIPASALSHIFDRFYQADVSRHKTTEASGQVLGQGFGLGLALVKRIVDLHGWSITVESKEKKGTMFRIVFGKGGKSV